MDLFIPYITVQPVSPVNDSIETKPDYNTTAVSQNSEFQKIYFEELARKYYEEDGNFNAISNIARIHYEEYYGGGSTPLKRWKIYFSKYNVFCPIPIYSLANHGFSPSKLYPSLKPYLPHSFGKLL